MRSCLTVYTYRSIVQAMKTSHKLAIVAASILVIAAISYMIYRNAQPRPKAAIEIPTTTQEIPKPTETIPEATPQPTRAQETTKQLPLQTETTPVVAQAIATPTSETGGVEISNVTQATSYTAMVGSDKITYCDLVFSDSTTQRIKVLTIHPSQDGITIGGQYFCSQWIGTSKTKIAAHFQ